MTPLIASLIFTLSCFFGMKYRQVWKAEGPSWKLWVYGSIAACGLLILGFTPLNT